MTRIFLIQIAFIVLNILNAVHDADRIKKHKRIYHAYFGGGYIIAIGLVCWLTGFWYLGPPLLFLRQLTFDPFLNKLRGLPINYIPSNPKSLIDQLENKIFGRNWNLKAIVYVLCLLVSEFLLITSVYANR
jgi:hypothetical protein